MKDIWKYILGFFGGVAVCYVVIIIAAIFAFDDGESAWARRSRERRERKEAANFWKDVTTDPRGAHLLRAVPDDGRH